MRASDHPRATYYYHIGNRGNPGSGVRSRCISPRDVAGCANSTETTVPQPAAARRSQGPSRGGIWRRVHTQQRAGRTRRHPSTAGATPSQRRPEPRVQARSASRKSAMARSSGLPDVNASNANRLRRKLTAMPRMRGLQSVRKCFRLMSRTSMRAPAGEVVSAR